MSVHENSIKNEKRRIGLFSSVLLRKVRQLVSGGRGLGGAGSDDPVGQEVAQRHGDGQSLHLLRGLHPAEGHSAQVLQAGDATGTLPEVHAAVTGPASKQTAHQRKASTQAGSKTRPKGGRRLRGRTRRLTRLQGHFLWWRRHSRGR